VTTPRFSPDGHTLVFVEFSSDTQAPFDRHNALYTIQVTGSGPHQYVGKPRLLTTANSLLLELGAWINSHVLTFYSDGALYALDIRSGAVSTIAQTGSYAHIVAIVEQG
jgi:Tol biopolymer transport system component